MSDAPRCAHHATVPAAVQCRGCGRMLCRLCVHIKSNLDTCADCGAACRELPREDDDSYYAAVELVQTAKPRAAAQPSRTPESRKPAALEPPSPPAAAPPIAGSVPRPLLGARTPPYYCKHHPHEKASRACRHCNAEYCDACAKFVEGNPHCPDCGGQINPLLPEDQGGPPRGVAENLADAFAFPFRGSGPLLLVFGSALVFICQFGGYFAGPKVLLFGYAFMYTFGIKICNSSALGRRTPPDWPGLGDLTNALYYFIAWFVSQIPAFAYVLLVSGLSLSALFTGTPDTADSPDPSALMGTDPTTVVNSTNPRELESKLAAQQAAAQRKLKTAQTAYRRQIAPFYVLSLLGNLYLPMAVLALILIRRFSVLNPLFIAVSAARAGTGYLSTVLIFIAADVFRFLPSLGVQLLGGAELAPYVVPLLSAPVFLYLLMVSMRSLGVMYYFNQRRLKWFEA